MAKMKKDDIDFIYENVFLPPKLPQTHHNESGAHQLLKEVATAAGDLARSFPPFTRYWRLWAQSNKSIIKWSELYDDGVPCRTTITDALKKMQKDDILLFYIEPQNAAIMVRNIPTETSPGAVFECFEVLAKTDAVLDTKDALIRHFPARAAFVPESRLRDSNFIEELGGAIYKLSVEQLKVAMETTRKASNTVVEERQSAHPRLVTEWLFGAVLGSCGKPHSSTVCCKRVHDDVCWKNTNLPWRRSGVWLSVRVALQIALTTAAIEGEGLCNYKNFMLFLLSRLARTITAVTVVPDVLQALQVKLARRNAKLGSDTSPFVQADVGETLRHIDEILGGLWMDVVQRDNIALQSVPLDQVSTELRLRSSRLTLQSVWDRSQKSFSYSFISYIPPEAVRVKMPQQGLPKPEMFARAGDDLFSLVDFELWVEMKLDSWITTNFGNHAACQLLLDLIKKYHTIAKSQYQSHPERLSVMLLVIFELWLALDSIACALHPLLRAYPPEIPSTLFAPLLLSKRAELERLTRVELHIKSRESRCTASNPSLFSDPAPTCFAVKFFDTTLPLGQLRAAIELESQQARDLKLEEWRVKKEQYENLMNEAKAIEKCGVWIPRGEDEDGNKYVGRPTHHRRCYKCAKKKQAEAIEISKHEWALPSDETLCKAVVFELGAPEAIVAWRDATFFLTQDLGRSRVVSGNPRQQVLLDYAPLEKHALHRKRRITLASCVKPMLKSHYIKSSLNVDPVLVENGLVPRMHDASNAVLWTAEQSATLSLQGYCNIKLQGTSDKRLGSYVNFTTHTTNSVIARQSMFLPNMGTHEAMLYGSLRSGERLQIFNILGALVSPEIDMNSPATAALFRHAICQVGTMRNASLPYLRESQAALEDENFSRSLLDAIEAAMMRIEANFKEVSMAAILLRLSLKTLSLTPFPEITQRCMAIVLLIRQTSLTWIRQMSSLRNEQKNSHTDSIMLRDLSRQILAACILCRRTYALDNNYQRTMFRTDHAATDYVEASVHLHTHRSLLSATVLLEMQNDLLSDDHLARQVERLLQVVLVCDGSAISSGIKRFWNTATFTNRWERVHAHDSSWIRNQVSAKSMHYNLVTGSLLVAGRAIAQLPGDYMADPLYRAIFKEIQVDVFPADVDDMEYVSKDEFHGHRVYFGLRGTTLLIRSHSEGQMFEAIPRDRFLGDLPRAIIDNSTPWMSLADGCVVFRHRERPFSSEEMDSGWTLYPALNSRTKNTMSTNQKQLIDMHSQVGGMICNMLLPIEKAEHLTITAVANLVEVELPRYHLHFEVDSKGRMVCKELSAYVDSNQEVGTLHGLQSRLILRAKSGAAHSSQRTVLIPNGKLEIVPASPHVRVRVQLDDSDALTLSHYGIDVRLGQLSSQDLEAHLYKAYLHAITSFSRPDALTGRTGVEESLFALSDPICKTCIPLGLRAQDLLRQISQLTPVRRFYPIHLKTMQSTTFLEGLSVMTQRDIFFGTANNIVAHNLKASCLFETAEVQPLSYGGDFGLLDRSHHRTRKLFPGGSVALASHTVEDVEYHSRDQDSGNDSRASATMAGFIEASPVSFSVTTSLKNLVLGWKKTTGFHEELDFGSLSILLDRELKDIFPSLMHLCQSTSVSKDRLIFMVSLIVFGEPALAKILRAPLAFAIAPALSAVPGPHYNDYDLIQGFSVNHKEVMTLLAQCEYPFESDPASSGGESNRDRKERLQFEKELGEQRQLILEAVNTSWPGERVRLTANHKQMSHYNIVDVKNLLDGRMTAWYKNYIFLQQLEGYDEKIGNLNKPWTGPAMLDLHQDFGRTTSHPRSGTHFSLLDLMNTRAVKLDDFCESRPTCFDQDLTRIFLKKQKQQLLNSNQTSRSLEELEDIVADLENDPTESVRGYGRSLGDSIKASTARLGLEQPMLKVPAESDLSSHLTASRAQIAYLIQEIRKLLNPCQSLSSSQQGLVTARLWPQVSELTLLQLLSAEHRQKVPHSWMPLLLQFACEITAAQRIERLQKLLAAGDVFAVNQELSNPAHSAWSPETWPDWLLLECQNNMLIRPVQIRVAKELLKPRDGTVLLGMGEGKTSIILPMVATALAEGSSLVRVVVLKPLANEMLRILSQSFAGLVGRALYYLPFSRQTILTPETPGRLMGLYQECRRTKGILLTLPEYMNSFRLVGIDKLAPGSLKIANELIRVQSWLDTYSKDILDESDELCKPAYELVYTSGQANLLSSAPERWNVGLEVLDLVRKHAVRLHNSLPNAFEVELCGHGAFPRVRILNYEGAVAMAKLVTKAIVKGCVPSLSLGHCDPDVLQAIGAFLIGVDVEKSQFELLNQHFRGSAKFDLLYVARGLIAFEILSHTLGKRWLVDYGLDRTRTLSAVPYRAKSVPSTAAEFAQPEAAIILTALSFYYTGLLPTDLKRCLLTLLRLPDPTDEYSKWVTKDSTLPAKYHRVASINLDDAFCLDVLYSHLRYNSALINFFLRHAVYPSEAKEFRWKISASAWDLCCGANITVGFSGTNDSRTPILPKDLPDLSHIPASTLCTLLRFENRQYCLAESPSRRRLGTKALLQRILADGPVDVCIDVGAQMLEENVEISQIWLQLSQEEKLAAIYFSEDDRKMVLTRNGTTEPLASSIFKDELRSCLIYLDQFHTRGTDFRLPDNFKAAVLLGPSLLKDNLAQACMRMRKLAVSQSVRFYASPEVDQAIRSIMKDPSEEITSLHVVKWVIDQSCLALKKQGPLFASRGLLHSRRRLAAERHTTPDGMIVNEQGYLRSVRERESRTVAELYDIGRSQRAELPFKPSIDETRDAVMKELLVEFERTNVSNSHGASITQEQEREILHEVEEERELQVPREVEAAAPGYSRSLLNHIRTGSTFDSASELRLCFQVLEQTRLEYQYQTKELPRHVLVTPDYLQTIKTVDGFPEDDFLRPVQWVLKIRELPQPIVISSHEAQIFLPYVKSSSCATLHMYMARTSRDMIPFDAFSIVQIPANNECGEIEPLAVALLNLFAGQLYFSSFLHYQEMCTLIGLFDGKRALRHKRNVANDNFVSPSCRTANGWTECGFKTSPVSWLKSFIDMRRLGIEWSHTHMGRVLDGQILKRYDFDGDVRKADDAVVGELSKLTVGEKDGEASMNGDAK